MIKEDCEKNQLNIKSFLKDELKGLKLRQFLVHIKNCSYCYDELLDEFIADTVFRDNDTVDNKNMSFNFKKELDKKIENYTNIVTGSDTKKLSYIE